MKWNCRTKQKKYNNFIVQLLFGDKYFINSNLELISLSYFEEFQSLFAFNQPDYIITFQITKIVIEKYKGEKEILK